MKLSTPGFILVRVANKGKPNEFILPQRINANMKRSTDADGPQIPIFTDEASANITLQRCKLARPESNLEVRQAVLTLEVL